MQSKSIMKKMTLLRYHELSMSLFNHEPYQFVGDAYYTMLTMNDENLAKEFKASKYSPVGKTEDELQPFFKKLKQLWKQEYV